MSAPFIANIILTLDNEDDVILYKAMLGSIASVVDGIRILDTTLETSPFFGKAIELAKDLPPFVERYVYESAPGFIKDNGFAAARNKPLALTPEGAYVLWVDSDEVHFTDGLLELKSRILAQERYDDISTHFCHFCIASNFYERYERRINIFRKWAGTEWQNKVHEKVVHAAGKVRPLFASDYQYHHYGYVRGQEYVFSRWYQYALLEGQLTPYEGEEVDGKTVPYFREGREGPNKILEDRKKTLLPYFGQYPAAMPPDWLQSKALPDV